MEHSHKMNQANNPIMMKQNPKTNYNKYNKKDFIVQQTVKQFIHQQKQYSHPSLSYKATLISLVKLSSFILKPLLSRSIKKISLVSFHTGS